MAQRCTQEMGEKGVAMGFLSDFFRFVAAVMLGKQDSSRTFFEPLIMAERYLRWGAQRQDVRDFRRAMEYLDNVRDDEAPKPDTLLRKYLCQVDITEGLIRLLIAQYNQTKDRLLQNRQEKATEAQNLRAAIEISRKRVEDHKSEGSLIKAKEEERRIEESNMRLQTLEQDLRNMPEEAEMRQHFNRLTTEAETLLQDVERALVVLQTHPGIAANAIKNFCEQTTARTAKLREDIQALNPAGECTPAGAAASSPTNPPPLSSAPSSPANGTEASTTANEKK